MPLPSHYTLTLRVAEELDEADIELRTPNEKYTIAENIPDDSGFAELFVAAPDLLEACELFVRCSDATPGASALAKEGIKVAVAEAVDCARAAIAKAKGSAMPSEGVLRVHHAIRTRLVDVVDELYKACRSLYEAGQNVAGIDGPAWTDWQAWKAALNNANQAMGKVKEQ